MIITWCYRPPWGAVKGLNTFLENVFRKANTEKKLCFAAGDFSLNYLDYNKSNRVKSKTTSLIDNIFANFIFDTSLKLKKGIIKSDVSDHLPVFVCSPSKIHKEYQKITICTSMTLT